MLKGIPATITPDLLKVLAEMGHDEAILFADANFTAQRITRYKNPCKPLIYLPVPMRDVIAAVLAVFPLVADEKYPLAYMQVSNTPKNYRSALQRDIINMIELHFIDGQSAEAIERFAFYERCQSCYAVVKTAEMQPYGNFILRKGIIADNLLP